eukprot:TRINITY_DN60899_c0_g1_i1.p1 TRINITY_DN60899_c0_g1~~TRINITY_DN60899_c0_g1_i1.p1  ORF type:complete len:577 (+),score=91.97 TRINITY_DN60899_c0_g1_i1:245-1975(+)
MVAVAAGRQQTRSPQPGKWGHGDGLGLKGWTKVISEYGREKQWQEALASIRRIRERKVEPNIFTTNALLSALGRSSRWTWALESLGSFCSQMGLVSDAVTHNSVIAAAQRAGEWLVTIEILRGLQRDWLSADTFTYNGVMKAACDRGGPWERATWALHEMQRLTLRSDATSSTVSMGLLGHLGRWELAASWQDRQQADAERSRSEVTPLNAAAKVLADNARQWTAAVALLHSAGTVAVQTDIISHNTALTSLEECSAWQLPLTCLDHQLARGLTADLLTYTGAMACEATMQQWQPSAHLLQAASELAGLEVDVVSYNALAGALEGDQCWESCMHLLTDAANRLLLATIRSYTAALAVLSAASLWATPLSLLMHVRSQTLQADMVLVNAAIAASGSKAGWQLQVARLADILAAGLQPDVITQATILSSSIIATPSSGAEERKGSGVSWPAALRLLHLAALRGTRVNAELCTALGSQMEATSDWRRQVELLCCLDAADVTAEITYYSSLVGSLAQAGAGGGDLWQMSEEVLRRFACRRLEIDALQMGSCSWRVCAARMMQCEEKGTLKGLRSVLNGLH